MNVKMRKIEVDVETADLLEARAAALGMSVSALLAEIAANQTILPPELAQMCAKAEGPWSPDAMKKDAFRLAEFERTRMGVPWDEIKTWMQSWGNPRSSNRTCGFPASGSPTGFTVATAQAPQGMKLVVAPSAVADLARVRDILAQFRGAARIYTAHRKLDCSPMATSEQTTPAVGIAAGGFSAPPIITIGEQMWNGSPVTRDRG